MDFQLSHFKAMVALLALLFFTGMRATVHAEGPSVSATLSSASASVGEPVELQINVTGASRTAAPDVRVDGLSVQYNGKSSRVEMNNFDVTRSITHTFTLTPQHEGVFTIPAIRVEAGGSVLTTRPLKLTVAKGETGGASGNDRLAFAEWVLPKTTAYIGEAVPAELRLYLASNVQWSLQQFPSVTGDGFIAQKIPQKLAQSEVTKDGKPYKMVIFKTALTAVKVGKLTLPATEINAIARVPRKRQARPRMPGFSDMFDDPLFNQAFGLVEQDVKIETDPLEMEVKPLPAAGKPKNFSGGIGQFTLQTKASPTRLHAGDPVTVTAEVSGIGNFDRLGAPAIAEEPGWRAYPPSSKFKADDEVGISGTKTFETALIAESPKSELPRIEFSFFDPSKAQYVTLTGERIPITVEGSTAPSPTPANAIPAPSAALAAHSPTPQPKANDILFIRTDAGQWGLSFEPAWRTAGFWWSQLIPLAALLGLSGWRRRQNRLGDLRARRLATMRQAKAEAERQLRQSGIAPGAFFDAAVRVLQLETVLKETGNALEREPAALDADAVCASRPLDAETAASVRALFSAHDELRYAGTPGGESSGETLPSSRRDSVLQTLERFEKSHV